ncbi:PQQ-binding-like beta-propeller repeat protein [Planctomycetaceae bacterium SH139]
MVRWASLLAILFAHLFAVIHTSLAAETPGENDLWRAAAGGDLPRVQACLDADVPVDAANRYGVTALLLAVEHSHPEIAELLLEKGANPSVRDRFYGFTPMSWAVIRKQHATITELVNAGADDSIATLSRAIQQNKTEVVSAILAAHTLDNDAIRNAAILARAQKRTQLLEQLLENLPQDMRELPAVDPETLDEFVGYFEDKQGQGLLVSASDQTLAFKLGDIGSKQTVYQTADDQFEAGLTKLVFKRDNDGKIVGLTRHFRTDRNQFSRIADTPPADKPNDVATGEEEFDIDRDWLAEVPESFRDDYQFENTPWSGFRGYLARGISSDANIPTDWDLSTGRNLAWKASIPGLANSCPIVWEDRIYLTTAVSKNEQASGFSTGLSGDVASVTEADPWSFRLLCLDLKSGELIWEREAYEGIPAVKRHAKSSHANATPVTDGRLIVASFGTEGVYCYDTDGNQVWKRDLGLLDSGWFYDRTYQWGFGSSPCLVDNRLILQCDIQDQSFLIALDFETGETIWKTDREEIPTWGSPVAYTTPTGTPIVVVSGTQANAAYDSRDGRELWRVGGFSEIVAPTPQVTPSGVLLASGYSPVQPLAMVAADAEGQLELREVEEPADDFVWAKLRGGPYMSTPIIHNGLLYVCSTNGVLDCYVAATGRRLYKERIRGQGASSFTGSPVASANHTYFPSEQGVIKIVRSGPKFELIGSPSIDEATLSTPAISQGYLLIRGERHLFAFKNESR